MSFGLGKISDGGEVCIPCFKKIEKADRSLKLKEQTLADIQRILEDHANGVVVKDTRLEEIKNSIKNLKLDNISSFFGKKEINELPKILAQDEQVDNLVQGIFNNGQGILVSTNRRLIFVDKGLLYGVKVEDFPLDKISSIQYETGLMFGKVKIHTTGNVATIEQVDKTSSRKFAEFVRDKLSRPKETVTQAASQPNLLDQIEKLGKLKESGILSDEEFTEQKKKLLEKL
jgi:hypothetical protein